MKGQCMFGWGKPKVSLDVPVAGIQKSSYEYDSTAYERNFAKNRARETAERMANHRAEAENDYLTYAAGPHTPGRPILTKQQFVEQTVAKLEGYFQQALGGIRMEENQRQEAMDHQTKQADRIIEAIQSQPTVADQVVGLVKAHPFIAGFVGSQLISKLNKK